MKEATQSIEDTDKNTEGSGDDEDGNRDKSKGQKYAKMRDQLPNLRAGFDRTTGEEDIFPQGVEDQMYQQTLCP